MLLVSVEHKYQRGFTGCSNTIQVDSSLMHPLNKSTSLRVERRELILRSRVEILEFMEALVSIVVAVKVVCPRKRVL